MRSTVAELIRRTTKNGFCCFDAKAALVEELLSGMRKRHFSISVSELKIKSVDKARANSLSAKYGFGAFPFHTDFAFRAIPPRFILLLNPTGAHIVRPTYVSRFEDLPPTLLELLRKCTWRLLSSGDHYLVQTSFALYQEWGLRWDRDFLTPANSEAIEASETLEKVMLDRSEQMNWAPNSAIMIDNWRCVHARGGQHDATDSQRSLRRIQVAHSKRKHTAKRFFGFH